MTYGLLEEDIFWGAGVIVLGAGAVAGVGAVGCFRGDFGVWAAGGDAAAGGFAAGAGLGASAGFGESFGLSDTFKVSVDAGPFS